MPFTPQSVSSSTTEDSVLTEKTSKLNTYDGVAVVGMACRVAGDNESPDQLWEFLLAQKDGAGEIPSTRWEPYYRQDPRNKQILSNATSGGYFVQNLDDFDPQFFGISPNEAKQMDPQQRVSLEVAWEALQDAGISTSSLKGTNTSVFWGVDSDDYSKLLLEDLSTVDAWMGIGTAYCGVPNRISYHLDVMGPSVAVDAACASSLVAVHHGVSAIQAKESNIAIVGGVNALYGPGLTTVLQRAGALAPDGRCRSFDDGAVGYGRGEGAGAVILKDLAQAIRDGDNILGIAKGSSVAHDGKKNGIMTPNAAAQSMVAQNALRVAGLEAQDIQYVEAHATSTPLGDPTEISALSTVYGSNLSKPCFIGSIKPNIGHLEAGAGVMGMIKAILALEKGILPPQANLKTLNSHVDWKNSGLEVVQSQKPWPFTEGPRRAAVCSYGYGGTVSHVILEEFRGSGIIQNPPQAIKPHGMILLVSAPHKKRLPNIAETLLSWIKLNGTEENLASICTTLATRRDHYEFRVAAIIQDLYQAIQVLESLQRGSKEKWMVENRCLPQNVRKEIVWVFSGHGAQWTEMGKELLNDEVFFSAVKPLDEVVQVDIGSSPIEWLNTGDFQSTDRVQILMYIMQIGITAILKAKGVFPNAVIGHSVGEIAASVVAGAISPTEGVLVVTRRAVLYREVMGQGAMILVNKPSQYVTHDIKDYEGLAVAIDSSPSSCVVGGPKDSVALITEQYNKQGVKTFLVKTDVAFHTPMMGPLGDSIIAALSGVLNPTKPSVKLYSTALSDPRGQDLRDPEYWKVNMINTVKLKDAVICAANDGYRVFLEVASHPLVSHSITEALLDREIEEFLVSFTMRREQSAHKSIQTCVNELHCSGFKIDWATEMEGPWERGLPTGPWLHQQILPSVSSSGTSMEIHDVNQHNLLGSRVPVAGTDNVVYISFLDRDSKPFPGDPPVSDTEIVPAACLLNTFLGIPQVSQLQNVSLKVPVVIDVPRRIQVVVQGNQLKIMSQIIQTGDTDDSSWLTHTTASWNMNCLSSHERIDPSMLQGGIKQKQPDTFAIDYLASVGVAAMGFPWKVLEHYGDSSEMFARVDATPEMEVPNWDQSSWAPLLDAATSIGSCIFFDVPRLRMPSHVQQVYIAAGEKPPKLSWIHVRKNTGKGCCSDIQIVNDSGEIIAKFTTMQFSEIEGDSRSHNSVSGLVHRIAWPPAQLAEDPLYIDQVIFVSSDVMLAQKYAESLSGHIDSLQVSTPQKLQSLPNNTFHEGTTIVYIAAEPTSLECVFETAENGTWQLLEIMKFAVKLSIPVKVFVFGVGVMNGQAPAALANAPLVGLSRVLASEHPDEFGGFIDCENPLMPLTTMKYVQDADVIRILDGIPRTARLRPLLKELRTQPVSRSLPRPQGTYLITGGLGALGIATAEFLVENGARRLVLLSRRSLPARETWDNCPNDLKSVIAKILDLEEIGVTVHVLPIDVGTADAPKELIAALKQLNLPPVLGVVHAAGVLENELVLESTKAAFHRVFLPKIRGALALNEAFSPGTLDFFMLFSSCGQLLGFPGQGSYGSANAFLDTLATYRRNLGENSIAFQWTSWCGMGLGSDSEFVAAELHGKGITDITCREAFQAWTYIGQYSLDHAVVLRTRELSSNEPIPTSILQDVISRSAGDHPSSDAYSKDEGSSTDLPSGPELTSYLDERIRSCVAQVLQLSPSDVDSRSALSDLGLDSVMGVVFRRQLQQTFQVNVPPTLVWNHPTVKHLVAWFKEKLARNNV